VVEKSQETKTGPKNMINTQADNEKVIMLNFITTNVKKGKSITNLGRF
jgi:hypothetical protein